MVETTPRTTAEVLAFHPLSLATLLGVFAVTSVVLTGITGPSVIFVSLFRHDTSVAPIRDRVGLTPPTCERQRRQSIADTLLPPSPGLDPGLGSAS